MYAFVVQFVTSGRGDEHQAAEWIRKAYGSASAAAPGTR